MITSCLAVALLSLPMADLNELMEESTVMVTTGSSQGSAFFASPTKAITAAHVVSDARTVRLTFAPDSVQAPLTATVTYADPRSDIAVLTVTSRSIPALTLAQSLPEKGSPAYVIGAPDGDFRVTAGVITAVDAATGQVTSSARVFPGNSGGPMVDEQGRVIGLVSQRTEPANESVAVPVSEIQSALSAGKANQPAPVEGPSPSTGAASIPMAAILTLGVGLAVVLLASRSAVGRRSRKHITITLDDIGGIDP